MKISKYIAIAFLFVLFSCSNDDIVDGDPVGSNNKVAFKTIEPGVVLTFDDDYVEDWKRADT